MAHRAVTLAYVVADLEEAGSLASHAHKGVRDYIKHEGMKLVSWSGRKTAIDLYLIQSFRYEVLLIRLCTGQAYYDIRGYMTNANVTEVSFNPLTYSECDGQLVHYTLFS
jgi:hypothetical protein